MKKKITQKNNTSKAGNRHKKLQKSPNAGKQKNLETRSVQTRQKPQNKNTGKRPQKRTPKQPPEKPPTKQPGNRWIKTQPKRKRKQPKQPKQPNHKNRWINSEEHKPRQVSPWDCTGCELCVRICPADALKLADAGKVIEERFGGSVLRRQTEDNVFSLKKEGKRRKRNSRPSI